MRIPHGESVGCPNQRISDSRFRGCVARIGDDFKMGFGPGLMQGPGGFCRGHNIITALNNDTGKSPKTVRLREQLVIVLKKTPVDEIVTLNAGKSQRKSITAKLADELGVGPQ